MYSSLSYKLSNDIYLNYYIYLWLLAGFSVNNSIWINIYNKHILLIITKLLFYFIHTICLTHVLIFKNM